MVRIRITELNQKLQPYGFEFAERKTFNIRNATTKELGKRLSMHFKPFIFEDDSGFNSSSTLNNAIKATEIVLNYFENNPEISAYNLNIITNVGGRSTGWINMGHLKTPSIYTEDNNVFGFTITFKKNTEAGGIDDNNNDCLYWSLRRFKPELWKISPTLFKLKLNLKKTDKIAVEKLRFLDKFKIQDSVYVNNNLIYKGKKPQNKIFLKLENEHYTPLEYTYIFQKKPITVKPTTSYDYLLRNPIFKLKNQERTPFYYFSHVKYNNNLYGENGILNLETSDTHYFVNIAQFLDIKPNLPENEIFNFHFENYKQLKEKFAKNFHIYFDLGYESLQKTVLYYFTKMRLTPEPTKINCYEANLLQNLNRGGLRYAKPGQYNEAHLYDINSFYPSIMNSMKQIPISEPEFVQDQQELQRKLYGIYKLKFHNYGKYPHLFSTFYNTEYFTHEDIKTMDLLNIEYEIEYAYIYYDRVPCNKMFGEYIKRFYEIKQNETGDVKTCAKKFLNNLHGFLGMRNQRKIYLENNKETETVNVPENFDIASVKFSNNWQIKLTRTEQPFKWSYSRCTSFILNIARNKMITTMIKLLENNIEVLYAHTDSFLTAKNTDLLPVSQKLGEWKLEKSGPIRVINKNKKQWV